MESAELIAILHEVRDRVRARNPEKAAATGIPLPDLMPLVHAATRRWAKWRRSGRLTHVRVVW